MGRMRTRWRGGSEYLEAANNVPGRYARIPVMTYLISPGSLSEIKLAPAHYWDTDYPASRTKRESSCSKLVPATALAKRRSAVLAWASAFLTVAQTISKLTSK